MKKNLERTLGWIQDASITTSLKNVVQLFVLDSKINKELRTIKIPDYISKVNGKAKFIKFLENKEIEIPYSDLKGKGPRRAFKEQRLLVPVLYKPLFNPKKKHIWEIGPRNVFCVGLFRWASLIMTIKPTYVK